MGKYSKAIGATLGALVAWGAALGIDSVANLDVTGLTEAITIVGSIIGTYIAPKNKEA